MKKRAISMLLGAVCTANLLGGCSLLPFEDDVPFGKKEVNQVQEIQAENPAGQEGAAAGEETLEVLEETPQEADTTEETPSENTGEAPEETEAENTAEDLAEPESPLAQAQRMAAQYDYDGAISLLQNQPDYQQNTDMQAAVTEYQNTKATCVEYPLEEITHVFYHTLIKDISKAFDGDADEGGYSQYMTTIDEYNKITQIMYDKGYVLVSPHDMATVNEDGTMSRGSIMLPPGKIPFVLSQDDVSYYHYMDGDGFASRLVLDENGDVKCEYIEDDGSVSVGDYDMIPMLDSFVKEHPDFSYHGRKGIIALTGYDGVLGYRTDIAYKTRENLQEDQQKYLDEHPDFDFDEEVRRATEVAEAMKANGWEFASHTWGHKNATLSSAEELQIDNEKWEAYVAPIVGKTDTIIFAFGADIGDWQPFTMDNPKFAYFKGRGYNYYCNVDSSQYWVQITDLCLRQGRRNLDGYRMYYNPEMLSDLFDVSEVWEPTRPEVPPM